MKLCEVSQPTDCKIQNNFSPFPWQAQQKVWLLNSELHNNLLRLSFSTFLNQEQKKL